MVLKEQDYYELATDVVTKFATRNAEFKAVRDMVNLEWNLKNNVEGAQRVVDVTPFVARQHAVGVLTKNIPTLVVELAAEDFLDENVLEALDDVGLTDEGEKVLADAKERVLAKARSRADAAAEKLENILKGIFRATQDDQQKNLVAEQVGSLIDTGAFCLKTLYNGPNRPETSTETQAKGAKAGRCRYVIQVRDPAFVFPKMGAFGPVYVVEEYDRFASEVYAAWPQMRGKLAKGSQPVPPNQKVKWTEYWDDEVKCFWADGQVVMKPTPHKYGFQPYVYHEEHSFLWPLWKAGTWTTNNQLLSMGATHETAYVNSAWVLHTENGEDVEIDTTPGALNYLKLNEKIEPLQRGVLPIDLMSFKQLMELQAQMATFAAGAYGQLTQASGYAQHQALHAMEAKLLGPINVSQMGWRRGFMNVAQLLKAFPPQGLKIYGATDRHGRKVPMFQVNGSDDIPDDPVIEVILKPMLPQDRMQLATLGSMLVDKGLMARETVQTDILGVESAVEENMRIREDLISMSAEVQKVYSTSAALRAQAEEEPRLWEARLAAAQKSLEARKQLALIEQELQQLTAPPSPPGLMPPGMEERPIMPQELQGGGQPPAPEMPLPSPEVQPFVESTGNTPVPPDGGQMEAMRAMSGVLPPRPQES